MNIPVRDFCARELGNKTGKCEGRVVISERPYIEHGQEERCRTCGRVIVTTFGPPLKLSDLT